LKNKILGLSVCMLLIASAVLPVVGIADIKNHVDSEAHQNSGISTTMKPFNGGRDILGVWVNPSPETVGGTLWPREYPTMAYDSSADRTIMFGGLGFAGDNKDTWAYSYIDNKWYNMSPGVAPAVRNGHTMCYDSDADMTIMFGGWTPGVIYNDTWAYDSSTNTWTELSALPTYGEVGGTLSKRFGPVMVYDSSAKRTIMFGGCNNDVDGINETWVYNSSDNHWYNMSPEVVGGPLNDTWLQGMAYDSSADRTIMFSGLHEAEYYWTNETWVYDYNDNKWYRMNPETVGGTLWDRVAPVMVYDSDADRTILFGGQIEDYYQLNDMWVYNFTDNTWYNISYSVVGGTLYGRECAGMVYDSTNMRTILFGGFSNDAPDPYVLNDTWIFKYNIGNEPPNPPTNPNPANGSLYVDIDADLSWYCWDPDLDDLTYDVYFEAGDSTPDVKVSSNQSETTYDPGTMDYNETYYWQIVAWEPLGNSTAGQIWHFTTKPPYRPDLYCDGSLSWSKVYPGQTVKDSFKVSNIGEPLSLLDWKVESYPVWGTWSFNPEEGTDLAREDEPVNVFVTVIAPDEKNSEFNGTIKIINLDNSSDFCTIDVSLTTPKNKMFNFYVNVLINWLFERFPNAFPILRYMLGL